MKKSSDIFTTALGLSIGVIGYILIINALSNGLHVAIIRQRAMPSIKIPIYTDLWDGSRIGL